MSAEEQLRLTAYMRSHEGIPEESDVELESSGNRPVWEPAQPQRLFLDAHIYGVAPSRWRTSAVG